MFIASCACQALYTDSSELVRRQQVNTDNTTADIHDINTMSNLQAHTETCDSLLLG